MMMTTLETLAVVLAVYGVVFLAHRASHFSGEADRSGGPSP